MPAAILLRDKIDRTSPMRFDLPSYSTYSFADMIYVHCPQCAELAVVKTTLPKYLIPFPHGAQSVCHCNHCGYLKKSGEVWHGQWVGTVSSRCGDCGTAFSCTSAPVSKPFDSIRRACDFCQREGEHELRWCKVHGKDAIDPFFGLPLYLTLNIKGNELWFFNEAHLHYIRTYVASTLRESLGRHKYSIVANLPQWVKSAKNRDVITKKTDQLAEQLRKTLAAKTPQ